MTDPVPAAQPKKAHRRARRTVVLDPVPAHLAVVLEEALRSPQPGKEIGYDPERLLHPLRDREIYARPSLAVEARASPSRFPLRRRRRDGARPGPRRPTDAEGPEG